jgi:hypothetical protein
MALNAAPTAAMLISFPRQMKMRHSKRPVAVLVQRAACCSCQNGEHEEQLDRIDHTQHVC